MYFFVHLSSPHCPLWKGGGEGNFAPAYHCGNHGNWGDCKTCTTHQIKLGTYIKSKGFHSLARLLPSLSFNSNSRNNKLVNCEIKLKDYVYRYISFVLTYCAVVIAPGTIFSFSMYFSWSDTTGKIPSSGLPCLTTQETTGTQSFIPEIALALLKASRCKRRLLWLFSRPAVN